jgi:CheY-like chemotaxis protein
VTIWNLTLVFALSQASRPIGLANFRFHPSHYWDYAPVWPGARLFLPSRRKSRANFWPGTSLEEMTPVSTARILVADDQLDILQAVRFLLLDSGYETDLVSSVGDVMDRMSTQTYDLLLMDLNYTRDTTSGREGLDLLDRVRAKDPGLPVVVMTGWGSIDTAVEAMRRGARSFVQKPWDDTTLIEVVSREVAEGQAARRRDSRFSRDF